MDLKLGLNVFSHYFFEKFKKKKKENQSGDIETWNQTNLKIVKNREKQIEKKKEERKKECTCI